MNQKFTRFATLLTLVFGMFSGSSNAYAAEWLAWDEILLLYPHGGGVNVIMKTATHPTSQCEGGRRFNLPANAANYEAKASSLIAAFTAGFKVQIALVDPATTCSPSIDRFMVMRE